MQKVAVFIDNSNVFRNLCDCKGVDKLWVTLYDPLKLAQRLASKNRELVYVGFYCVRPPAFMLENNDKDRQRYTTTTKYYAAIEKLDLVQVKYGDLQGSRGNLVEKNVDTQIATDMVTMAALGKYDVAILISNDGDYVSAVESVKNQFNKKIEVLFFKGSMSWALRKICDVPRRARRIYFEKFDW